MKNLMSRDEYLQNMNEGFIKDKLKKGWDKVKSAFKIGMKKIKGFIAIFSGDGHVLPVVCPQAVIDKFHGSNAVKVYAPKEISDSVIAAGGKGCEEKAVARTENEYEDDVPKGDDYVKWIESEEYKETIEERNFDTMFRMIKESYNKNVKDGDALNEDYDAWVKSRVKYSEDKAIGSVQTLDKEEFADLLNEMIEQRSVHGGKPFVVEDITVYPYGNVLVLGAPGIGKSTIPTQVIDAYNNYSALSGDPSKKISLLNINCSLINEGDFMMPTMPKEVNVLQDIELSKETYPEEYESLKNLDVKDRDRLEKILGSSNQMKSEDAPKSWLPSYKRTGDDYADQLNDAKANSGVYVDKEGHSVKTGGGGIILFDEFLRAKPAVFDQMMNFFLDREMNNWVLGSKWAVIACSNRPADDGRVEQVWKEWKNSPANRDRQECVFVLRPDPDEWRKWMSERGADPFLMEFIFEPSSMDGKEYPRWHTVIRRGINDAEQFKPVTPRRWWKAMNHINAARVKHYRKTGKKPKDVSELTEKEVHNALKLVFDEDFVTEITDWLRDHSQKVDLDAVMKDPVSTYLPGKFTDDPEKASTTLQNLGSDFKNRFGENLKDLKDEQLANIIIWLGINFKQEMNLAQDFIEFLQTEVFPEKGEYEYSSYIKTGMMVLAAYPCSDIEDDIEYYLGKEIENDEGELVKTNHIWPKDCRETIKGYMKKYFPWRIKGDEIQFCDKFNV